MHTGCGALIGRVSATYTTARSISDIPNPMLDPIKCGRPGVSKSAVCDPDKRLTKDIKDEIEGRMNILTNAQMAVVVINKMNLGDSLIHWDINIDKATETYARTLHDTWGVGKKETQNGILIFLSIYDRSLYISTGQGVSAKLSKPMLDTLINDVKDILRKGDYGQAIVNLIMQIEAALLMNKGNKHFWTSLRGGSVTRTKPCDLCETSWFLIIMIVFFTALIYLMWYEYSVLHSYEQGQALLQKLMKDVNRMGDNQYQATGCPICLEEFTTRNGAAVESKNIVSTATTAALLSTCTDALITDTKPKAPSPSKCAVTVRCGHVFCQECLTSYLHSCHQEEGTKKCPLCRQPLEQQQEVKQGRKWSFLAVICPFPYANRTQYNSITSFHDHSDYDPIHMTDAILYRHELRFRLYRLNSLYPSVLDHDTLRRMNTMLREGNLQLSQDILSKRNVKVGSIITGIHARSHGSGGSSRSFGGGRSFGGSGGRF